MTEKNNIRWKCDECDDEDAVYHIVKEGNPNQHIYLCNKHIKEELL